jgi:SAM-dependent methyltransferase
MKEYWNNRFSTAEYVFGKEPNDFLKQELDKITPGKVLFIAAGEGRNAVYAAQQGWQVDAIDYSETAKEKALKLATENNVQINYQIADIFNYSFPIEIYDVIVSIHFHCKEDLRDKFNAKLISALKPQGKIILQVFDKAQIKKDSGGPKDITMLYSLEDIVNGFYDLEFELFVKETSVRNIDGEKKEIEVIRFVGKKL